MKARQIVSISFSKDTKTKNVIVTEITEILIDAVHISAEGQGTAEKGCHLLGCK
jgi:hypothetical protein